MNERLRIGVGNIEVVSDSLPSEPLHKLVMHWIRTAAQAVTVYYERFPVDQVTIRVHFRDGRGVNIGRAFGWGGARVRISVGRGSAAADFANDWMLTHELVHLAFPSVPEQHHWIEEGLATYVEPIARARAGDLTAQKVWADMVDAMHQELPQLGDRGLDFTPTWGRTYWGGALFCLLADIEIRKQAGNRKGLEDAMRGILQAGGNIESDWPLVRALETADGATGVPVLAELYARMKATAVKSDLDKLWLELGVQRRGGEIVFDDSAPLASIRRAITGERGNPSM
jgi:hypothetical protein